MSDASDRVLALAELNGLADPDVNPKLSSEELGAILDKYQVAFTWTSNTQVAEGRVLAPATTNGRWYRVRFPGWTGSVEPNWPKRTGIYSSFYSIFDNSVILEDAGEALGNVYDVQAAAWEAWDKKARKASKYPKMSGIDVSSIFDHCIKIRDGFAPVLV